MNLLTPATKLQLQASVVIKISNTRVLMAEKCTEKVQMKNIKL